MIAKNGAQISFLFDKRATFRLFFKNSPAMRPLFCCITVLGCCLLAACESPSGQLVGLQRKFMRRLPPPDRWLIVEAGDTLALPLPPSAKTADQTRQTVAYFQEKIKKINPEGLDESGRQKLADFQKALDVVAQQWSNGAAPCRPEQFVVDELLLHFISDGPKVRHPALLVELAERLPAYVDTLRARSPQFEPQGAPKAVAATVRALDLLDQAGEDIFLEKLSIGYAERLRKALPSARRALKDFIGMCQSAAVN